MKNHQFSRFGIPKKTLFKDYVLSKLCIQVCPQGCPKGCLQGSPNVASKVAPNVASKVPPKSSKKSVSMIPPKAVHKEVSSKLLTKQPNSVPTSHLVLSLSLYIFGIVCS